MHPLALGINENFAKAWTRLTHSGPSAVHLKHGTALTFGSLELDLQRTLRVPNDGSTYPLPAGLGAFPLFDVQKYELPADIQAKR